MFQFSVSSVESNVEKLVDEATLSASSSNIICFPQSKTESKIKRDNDSKYFLSIMFI